MIGRLKSSLELITIEGKDGKHITNFIVEHLERLKEDQNIKQIKNLKINEFSYGFNKKENKTKELNEHNSKIHTMFMNKKDIKSKIFNKEERKKGLIKLKSSTQVDLSVDSSLTQQNALLNYDNNILGGPSYNQGLCDPYAKNPFCGDGQDRSKTKLRMKKAGDRYQWYPETVEAITQEISDQKRMFRLNFRWNNENLSNLNFDSNEAIEAEVLFYNYGPNENIPDTGRAWMSRLPSFWSTNLPGGYLDTRDLDKKEEVSYAVGTIHTDELKADITYFFEAQATLDYEAPLPTDPDQSPNPLNGEVGLWQINFQRGYWFDSKHPVFVQLRGEGDEWYVFNEEAESNIQVKKYDKYNSELYAPLNKLITGYFFDTSRYIFATGKVANNLETLEVGTLYTTPYLESILTPREESDLSSTDPVSAGEQHYEFEVTPEMVGKEFTFIISNDVRRCKICVELDVNKSSFMDNIEDLLVIDSDIDDDRRWRKVYKFTKPGLYYITLRPHVVEDYIPESTIINDRLSIKILEGSILNN